jgi:hypothetical protein
MKIPTKCPRCNEPLLNQPLYRFENLWEKSCLKKTSHKFCIIFDGSTNLIKNYIVGQGNHTYQFDFINKKVFILNKNMTVNTELPYFDGNFYEWNKLILKLKQYTLFL